MTPKVSQEHKEQRRAKLIQAATEVFIEHGYENMTMKHVMEKASVSRGGLYQYFENKEDLFEAVIQSQQTEALDLSIQTMIESQGTYWDALLMTFLGKEKTPNDRMDPLAPSKLEYFITGRNDKRRLEHARERYHSAIKLTTKLIEDGERVGEFTPRFEKQVIAKSIISWIDGTALSHSVLGPDETDLKKQSTLLIEYLEWVLGVKR